MREALLCTLLLLPSRPIARGHSGVVPPKLFVPPQFCCAQKILFQAYNLKKYFPLKMHFPPQTLKPGYGPVAKHRDTESILEVKPSA